MVRRILGKAVEWALGYERIVYFTGLRRDPTEPGFTNIPWSKHADDAGYDIFVDQQIEIQPGTVAEVHTGICLSAESSIWFEIKSRSSTFKRLGLEVQDAVIDNGFRGEMFAIVYNPTSEVVHIQKDNRICQLVPHLLLPCRFVPADDLPSSSRGTMGFGSTGV